MNIHEKIQQVGIELSKLKLKKSGYNSFAGFKYYELEDFLPTLKTILVELKLCSYFSITDNAAVLKVINLEVDTEVETFTISLTAASALFGNPVDTLYNTQAQLPEKVESCDTKTDKKVVGPNIFSNNQKILQSVGCMSTYLKRYLYMNAFDIIENDMVEATIGKGHSYKRSANVQGNGTRFYVSGNKVAANNPKVESYISKAESIHNPEEMNSFIAGLKDERLAPAEKHAIWNPIAETAKLQGWQLVNGSYV